MSVDGHLPLPPSIWEDLRACSTASLRVVLAQRGLQRLCMAGVRPLRPGARLAGTALTLRFVPSREDVSNPAMLSNPTYPQRHAVEIIEAGQVLVVEARGEHGAGILGGILALRMARRGAAGIVSDGVVRDAVEFHALNLPVFAAGAHPAAHPTVHFAVGLNEPVACGGVLVLPGDVIVGDDDGVIVVPRALAADAARDARAQDERARFVREQIAAGAAIADVDSLGTEMPAAFAQAHTGAVGEQP